MSEQLKYRNFAMILYPDSMPDGSIEKLLSSDIKVAISPLHQPESDETKPHYHTILLYDGPRDFNVLNEQLKDTYHCPKIQKVENVSQAMHYLIHLGWDTKIQYPFETIRSNFDIRRYFADDIFVLDIIRYCEDHNIHNYAGLIKNLMHDARFDYVEKVAKSSYFFKCYFEGVM